MSHFKVLVIGDDVEKLLAPYDEQLEVEDYEIDCRCGLYKADHLAHEQSRGELGFNNFDDFWSAARSDRDPKGLLVRRYRERAVKLLEANLDKDKPDLECTECGGTGRKLTNCNPKSKWDWYKAGGRWRGMLILKPGKSGVLGEPRVFGNEPEHPDDVDRALFGDVDWERMRNNPEERKRLEEQWDRIMDPANKDLKPGEYCEKTGTLYNPEYYSERYGTKENFVRRSLLFTTYAVVTEDGEWHEPGEMGWWGCSTETPEEKQDWDLNYFDRFLKNLKPDTLITIVDCHI